MAQVKLTTGVTLAYAEHGQGEPTLLLVHGWGCDAEDWKWQIPAFAARFNAIARERLTADDLVPELRVDLEVPLEDCTFDLENLLKHLEPCGASNPAPVLVSRDVRLAAPPQVVGQGGLKLRLASAGGGALTMLGWGMGDRGRGLRVGDVLDVAFRLERDDWNGEQRLQGRLADFQVHED